MPHIVIIGLVNILLFFYFYNKWQLFTNFKQKKFGDNLSLFEFLNSRLRFVILIFFQPEISVHLYMLWIYTVYTVYMLWIYTVGGVRFSSGVHACNHDFRVFHSSEIQVGHSFWFQHIYTFIKYIWVRVCFVEF